MTSNPSLPLNVTRTVAYDAIGNITSKSDVGLYTYDPTRVHAVASIVPGTTGTLTASYTYDGNGNLLSGNGRTVTWTSFDMVEEVVQGSNSLTFTYDSERNRLTQASSDGSTKYYLNDPVSGIMAEKVVGASLSVTWNDYIMVGAEMVALKVSGATSQTRYFHKDHLGSITALTDETGTVVESNSFDAWGHRRAATGPADPLYPGLSLTSQITRGYTGHEQLDQVGLVHMNGRIYDPVIGKMMSADPTVPNPIDGQSYNRYSYVYNNPLSLTDPTGFQPDREADRVASHHRSGNFGRQDDSWGGKGSPGGDQTGGAVGPRSYQTAEGPGVWDVPGMTSPAEVPSFWERVLDNWYRVYIERPIRISRAPFAAVGIGLGRLEQVCGACVDDGLDASLMGLGPAAPLAMTIKKGAKYGVKYGGKVARVLGGVETLSETSPLTRGVVSEQRVLRDLGLTKNTRSVTTSEGSSVPDSLSDTTSIEIKDALRVTNTPQVRVQTGAAQATGRESVLITGDRTKVSRAAEEAFDRIIRRSDLGPPY